MKTFYSFIFIFAISLQLFAGTSAKLEYPSFPANTRVRVAAANVMNYLSDFEASNASCKTQAAFDEKTDKMATVFVGLEADIVALCEVQQDDEILGYLVDAMNKKVGKNVYDYVLDGSKYNNPSPGNYGSIKCGYIYRIDKFSEGGRYSTNPNDASFRLRMQVISFTERSTKEKFVLSLNHFRAPSSDEDGSQRKAQATTLINALEINNYGDPDILIVGDLNAETTDDCLSPIVNAGYEEQLLKYDSKAYSYIYYGQKLLLNHAFANSSMAEQITGAYVYHLTSADNFTDHDVVVVGLDLGHKEPIEYNITLSCDLVQGSVTGPSTAEENEEVTLKAIPNKGYYFTQWSDGVMNNPRQVIITQDTTFTAEFALEHYTISVNSSDPAKGSVSGGGVFTYGESTTLIALPADNCQFNGWNDGNTDNPRYVRVEGNASYTAYFGVKKCKLKVQANDIMGGSVQGGGTFDYGTQVEISAKPNSGYQFLKWSNGAKYNPYTFTIVEDMDLIAFFQKTEAELVDASEVGVTPQDNSVTVVWPAVSGAATYELVVKDKSGTVICTLVFNAQGQLTQIVFNAPGREQAPQQTQSSGFSFTVTGLDEGTSYDLTLSAKSSDGKVLDQQVKSFTTTGELTNIRSLYQDYDKSFNSYKFISNGQLYIQRGEKTYNVSGKEIK